MPSCRQLLMPPGSRRERLWWLTAVTARKLREGPGPFWRALRKGLFQCLPTGVRRRLLRWGGVAPFRSLGAPPGGHGDGDPGVDGAGRVSVVLPVWNQADMLGLAIASVLAQDYRNLELLVVDDGSQDAIGAVLDQFRGDPRLSVLQQPNQGLPKALSTGFDCATGEFFTWTSADNLMAPDQLSTLVAFARRHPDVAMVYADYEVIDERGELLQGGEFRCLDRTDPRHPAAVRVNRSTADLNRHEDNFVGPCFLYRAQVGRLLGDYNPELGLEDYDYWMRVNRLFRLAHLGTDGLHYRYRVHANTLSARAKELRTMQRARVLMGYERQRGAFVDAPLRVYADPASTAWLTAAVMAPDQLLPLAALAAAPTEGLRLVLVDAATLPELPAAARDPAVGLAVTFPTPATVHAAAATLRDVPLTALAADATVAAHLAIHTRSVFVASGPRAFAFARRHAANAVFFRTTRDPARLLRDVPTPRLTRPRVLRLTGPIDAGSPWTAPLAALRANGWQVLDPGQPAAAEPLLELQLAAARLRLRSATSTAATVPWIEVAGTPAALANALQAGAEPADCVLLDPAHPAAGRQLEHLCRWLSLGKSAAGARELLRRLAQPPAVATGSACRTR